MTCPLATCDNSNPTHITNGILPYLTSTTYIVFNQSRYCCEDDGNWGPDNQGPTVIPTRLNRLFSPRPRE